MILLQYYNNVIEIVIVFPVFNYIVIIL